MKKTLASKPGKIYIYSFTFECRFILITLSLTFLCNIDYKAWIIHCMALRASAIDTSLLDYSTYWKQSRKYL